VGKESACSVGELCSIPGLGRCPGGRRRWTRGPRCTTQGPGERLHRLSHRPDVRRPAVCPLGAAGDRENEEGASSLAQPAFDLETMI